MKESEIRKVIININKGKPFKHEKVEIKLCSHEFTFYEVKSNKGIAWVNANSVANILKRL